MLKDYPLTREFLKELLAHVQETNPDLYPLLYAEYINKKASANLISNISCDYSASPRKGLGFLNLEPVGFSILVCNAKTQDAESQAMTICHEIAHLCIAYERSHATGSVRFDQPDTIEELCDYVAEILTRKRPFKGAFLNENQHSV